MQLSINQAVEILAKSGIVGLPTETVYGLMGVATDKIAVEKIFLAKNRPRDNPLICHFYSFSQIKKYVASYPSYFPKLIAKFSPGPVSFLLEIDKNSPLLASTNNLPQVAVRIPKHPITLEILQKLDQPLAGPSANTATKFSSTNVKMVEADFGDKIDGVVDGGSSVFGLESTILDCRKEGEVSILRPGAIGRLELEKFFDEKKLPVKVLEIPFTPFIPGNKYKHYSPKTPISVLENFEKIPTGQKVAILGEESALAKLTKKPNSNFTYLNLGKNIKQIGKNFYANLFYLDSLNLEKAFFIPLKPRKSSLYLAIQNKLEKIF